MMPIVPNPEIWFYHYAETEEQRTKRLWATANAALVYKVKGAN